MGQYRLWLQHREIDQLLQAQLKILVKELTQVDEQINLLAAAGLQADNVIMQALLKDFQVEVSPGVPVQAISPPIRISPTSEEPLRDAVDRQDQQVPNSVSSALFMWGRLPNFVSQGVQHSIRQTDLSEPLPQTPLAAETLLPADIQTFVQTYGPVAPQTKNLRRLPKLIRSSESIPDDSLSIPLDQQSNRVNQVVERWFERRTRFAQGDDTFEPETIYDQT